MFKAILFDFGGVILTHPKEVVPEVIAKIYNSSVEVAKEEYAHFRNDYYLGKIPTGKLISSLSATFKSNKSVEEVKELWIKYYSKLAKANRKILKIIKNLRKDYKVYLFSNTTEMSHLHNSKTGIYDYFDETFMSYQLGMRKPENRIYKKILSKIGCKSNECIFIDDSAENLEPAKKLGIKTILFNVLVDAPSDLKESLRKLGIKI